MNIFTIMQLADSALPVGSFAFSNGLEWMVKAEILKTEDEFISYLKGLNHQCKTFEFNYMNSFQKMDDESYEALKEWDELMIINEMRKASLTQGKAWLRLMHNLFPSRDLSELEESIRGKIKMLGLELHYLYVFSITLYFIGLDTRSIKELFLYMLIRDQISSAIRLGIIGPNMAQTIQAHVLGNIDDKYDTIGSYKDAYRSTVITDIAQGGHREIYSKLFQN